MRVIRERREHYRRLADKASHSKQSVTMTPAELVELVDDVEEGLVAVASLDDMREIAAGNGAKLSQSMERVDYLVEELAAAGEAIQTMTLGLARAKELVEEATRKRSLLEHLVVWGRGRR